MKTTPKHSTSNSPQRAAHSTVRQEPPSALWQRKTTVISASCIAAILLHLLLRFALHTAPHIYQIPLLATLVLGGLPLVYDLLRKLLRREFGSDLLGGISVVTSILRASIWPAPSSS